LTPAELRRRFKGAERRLEREHNERMSLAWHAGRLASWPVGVKGAKPFPKLDQLIIKPRGQRQSWQQQLAIAQMWAARGIGKMGQKSKAN
jgi:hypothetical protein